jgi:hypothetical protein
MREGAISSRCFYLGILYSVVESVGLVFVATAAASSSAAVSASADLL